MVVRGRVVIICQCRGKGGGGCVIDAGDRSSSSQGGCVINAVAVVIVIQVVRTVVNTDQ